MTQYLIALLFNFKEDEIGWDGIGSTSICVGNWPHFRLHRGCRRHWPYGTGSCMSQWHAVIGQILRAAVPGQNKIIHYNTQGCIRVVKYRIRSAARWQSNRMNNSCIRKIVLYTSLWLPEIITTDQLCHADFRCWRITKLSTYAPVHRERTLC